MDLGETSEAIDIRTPVGIEMEFNVLAEGHSLAPNFHVFNEEGTCVFIVKDLDPEWQRRARPKGVFTTTAWVPGNYLSEGTNVAACSQHDGSGRDALFRTGRGDIPGRRPLEGDSARENYAGPFPGVVRPMLKWTTSYAPIAAERLALGPTKS